MNTQKAIIVLNAGSSSLKFKVFNQNDLSGISMGQVSGIGTDNIVFKLQEFKTQDTIKKETLNSSTSREDIIIYVIDAIKQQYPNLEFVAAGHRVVHGGNKFTKPHLVDDELVEHLKKLIPLTPIHLPHNIMPMEILQKKYPHIKQVACFDTSFHSTNPNESKYYAIPRKLIEEDNIIRYGFHGLSYEYIVHSLQSLDPKLAKGKIIVCHLGAGASLAAIENGKGLTTTMGFTPLAGLPMGSRTGDIDPGILLYLMKYKNYQYKDLEDLLYYNSGMLGLSGVSSDFYVVETSDKKEAKEAWEIYKYNLVKHIGSYIAIMGGVDGIIFTAGVGENNRDLKEYVADHLSFLGCKLDIAKNNKNELVISAEDSKVKMMVIPTNEELMIAKNVVKLI